MLSLLCVCSRKRFAQAKGCTAFYYPAVTIAVLVAGRALAKQGQGSLAQAIGGTARTAMRLGQFDKDLKAAHCPRPDIPNEFHNLTPQLTDNGRPLIPPEIAAPPAHMALPTTDLGKYR